MVEPESNSSDAPQPQVDATEHESEIVFVPTRPVNEAAPIFGLRSVFLLMTLVAVLSAIGAAAPGLGIALALVAVPPFVRTTLLAHKRRTIYPKERLPAGLLVILFITSLILTITSIVVSCFLAGVCCFMVGYATMGVSGDDRLALGLGGTTAGMVLLAMWIALGKWAVSRWKADVRRPWVLGKEYEC
jgi:hypothetical protein